MPNLVEIAKTAAEIWRFFGFSRWWPPSSWILKFQIFNGRNGQVRQTASSCQISWRSVKPQQMTIFQFFQDGGRPPLIFDACVGTIHEGHFVVFITVQNLDGIDVVVLIICTFFDFACLA